MHRERDKVDRATFSSFNPLLQSWNCYKFWIEALTHDVLPRFLQFLVWREIDFSRDFVVLGVSVSVILGLIQRFQGSGWGRRREDFRVFCEIWGFSCVMTEVLGELGSRGRSRRAGSEGNWGGPHVSGMCVLGWVGLTCRNIYYYLNKWVWGPFLVGLGCLLQ